MLALAVETDTWLAIAAVVTATSGLISTIYAVRKSGAEGRTRAEADCRRRIEALLDELAEARAAAG